MYNNYVEIFKCRKYFTKFTQKGLLDAVNSIAKEFAYSDDDELNNLDTDAAGGGGAVERRAAEQRHQPLDSRAGRHHREPGDWPRVSPHSIIWENTS